MRYGSAIVGAGLLAGCAGDASDDEADPGDESESYSATLSPAGTVTFEAVPETVFTDLTHHAGMALALGRGDAVNATWAGSASVRSGTTTSSDSRASRSSGATSRTR